MAISSAAILVKLATGVHPLVLGFWRTAGVALLLAPSIRRVSRRDGLLILVAGICLGGHFWSWFASLNHTTVLRSTVLVTLNPIWLGLMEWKLLADPPDRRYWAGVGLAICGVVLMASAANMAPGSTGEQQWFGDALALLGGLLGSLYLFAGRTARKNVGLGTYGALICGVAALFLLPAALLVGAPLVGFSNKILLILLALTLGPQLLGHNGIGYAMRYMPASVVSTAILLEPVGAAVLALLILNEMPSGMEIIGALIVLVGVIFANLKAAEKPQAEGL